MLVRQSLRSPGVDYRLNRCELPDTPDLASIGRRKAIFVYRCFWHQRGFALTGKALRTRTDY